MKKPLLTQLSDALAEDAIDGAEAAQDAAREAVEYAHRSATRLFGAEFAAGLEWLPCDSEAAMFQAQAQLIDPEDGAGLAVAHLLFTVDEDGDSRMEVVTYCGTCHHTETTRVVTLLGVAQALAAAGVQL